MANEAQGVRVMATEARIKGVEHETKLNNIADKLDEIIAQRDAEIAELHQQVAAAKSETMAVSDRLGVEQQKNGQLQKVLNECMGELERLQKAAKA